MQNSIKTRLIIFFAFFFVAGLVLFFTGISDSVKASQAELDFNNMRPSQFEEGMFVKGRVYEMIDEFAYTETYESTFGIKHNQRVSSHYYIVPMFGSDEPLYVAVQINDKETVAKAEKLIEQTWDYIDTGKEPAIWGEFDIVGKVRPLEGELLDFMYEYFMEGDPTAVREEYSQYICPWIINYQSTENNNTMIILSLVFTLIGAVGIAVFITLFIKDKNGGAVRAKLPTVPYRPTEENTQNAYNPDDDPRFNMPVNSPSEEVSQTENEDDISVSDRWGD